MMFPTCFTLILGILHSPFIWYLILEDIKTFYHYFGLFRSYRTPKKQGREHGSNFLRQIQQAGVGHQEVKELDLGAHHASQYPGHVVQAISGPTFVCIKLRATVSGLT
jgi:hypothetical protein